MKKVMTLALALVLVFGLSAMVGATEGTLENDGTVGDSIEVDVQVEKYAFFEINEDADGLDLTFTEPGKSYSNTVPYTLKTNTPVTVEVKENLSGKFAAQFGNNKYVWADPAGNTNYDGDWIVSPNAQIVDDVKDGTGENKPGDKYVWQDGDEHGIVNPYAVNSSGKYTGDIKLESAWKQREGWWKLEAKTYKGTVTVTVAAQ